MKKRIKLYLSNFQNILILYASFVFLERAFDITKWSETMPEMFAFYSLAIIIFTYMARFKDFS